MRVSTNLPTSLLSAAALSVGSDLAARQLLSPSIRPYSGINRYTDGNIWQTKFSDRGFSVPAQFRYTGNRFQFVGLQNKFVGAHLRMSEGDDNAETDLGELARIWEELGIIPKREIGNHTPVTEMDVEIPQNWIPTPPEENQRERPGLRIPVEPFDQERQRRWEEERQRIEEESTPKRGVYIWDPDEDSSF